MTSKSFITYSHIETKKLGESIAKRILQAGLSDRAFVIGLIGDLGGGKTTFLQGFANGLGIDKKILSPTFVIMRRFQIPDSEFLNFYHFDCYRIEKPKELLALGFADICQNKVNIIAIEWADMAKALLPENTLMLRFKFLNKNQRRVKIDSYPFLDNSSLLFISN